MQHPSTLSWARTRAPDMWMAVGSSWVGRRSKKVGPAAETAGQGSMTAGTVHMANAVGTCQGLSAVRLGLQADRSKQVAGAGQPAAWVEVEQRACEACGPRARPEGLHIGRHRAWCWLHIVIEEDDQVAGGGLVQQGVPRPGSALTVESVFRWVGRQQCGGKARRRSWRPTAHCQRPAAAMDYFLPRQGALPCAPR